MVTYWGKIRWGFGLKSLPGVTLWFTCISIVFLTICRFHQRFAFRNSFPIACKIPHIILLPSVMGKGYGVIPTEYALYYYLSKDNGKNKTLSKKKVFLCILRSLPPEKTIAYFGRFVKALWGKLVPLCRYTDRDIKD